LARWAKLTLPIFGFEFHKLFTAITDQTNHKKNFESVALQRFQNFSWFGFERKALYSYN
jgi:hypothetical protein